MKKLLTFLTLLTLSIGVSWAGSYTIGFGANDDATTQIQSTTNASTVIKGGGTEYVLAKPFTVNSGVCYYSSKGNVRLGKSKASASLTIALSDKGIVKPISVVVNCHYMDNGNNDDATISVNNLTAQTTTAEYADYTFTFDGETSISSITLASSKSLYVNYITVNYIEETEPPVAPTTAINFDPESGSTVYSGTTVNFSLAVEGGANGIKYTTDGTDPKTYGTEGTSVTLNGNANDVITIKAVPFNTNSNGTTYGTVYTATYTLIEPQATVYRRINNINDLEVGAKYIILHSSGDDNTSANVMKKGVMSENTRPNVAKTIDIEDHSVSVLPTEDIAEFTLGGSENAYTFLCDGKYLWAGGGSTSYLNINGNDDDPNIKWAIIFDGNEVKIQTNVQTTTKYVSWYNNIFNIYTRTNTTYLYKEYIAKDYDVTVTQPEEGGTISASPIGTKVVNAGDKITVTATPATGYELTGWTITGANETEPDANNQITATGDVTITATFSKIWYTITCVNTPTEAANADNAVWLKAGFDNTNGDRSQVGNLVRFKVHTVNGWQIDNVTAVYGENSTAITLSEDGTDNLGEYGNEGSWASDQYGTWYSFTMPAGAVTITGTFRPYQPTIRLAGRFNGRPDTYWETGNNGPAFNYDSETEKYTMDVFFTGAVENENEMIDYFWFRSDNEDLKTSASGDYWLTDGENGNIYQAEGHNLGIGNGYNSNFRIKPGIYTFTINKDRTKLFITKKDVAFTFTPATGTTVEQNSTVTATSDLQTILNGIKNTYDNGAVIGTITTQVSTDNSTWGESATMSVIGTNQPVYAKSTLDNLIVTDQATYTVEAVNNSNKYQLITSTADLEAGKKYIIVSETKSKAAGAFSSKYLIDADVTIANNIATVTDDVMVFTLGGDATNGWTFTSSEGLMGANSSKDIVFDTNNAINAASISFGTQTLADESVHNEALITFGSNGHFIHNVNSARFKTYTSAYNVSMLPVQLYKQVDESAAPATATPVITPDSKDVKGGLLEGITITAGEEGTTPVIYYTTDGSDPGKASNANRVQYTEPFDMQVTQGGPQTVKAIAIEDGKDPSSIASVTYTFKNPAAPTFSPDPAVVQTGDFTVTINSEDGGTIYYVLDPDANEFPSNSEEAIATGQIYDNGVAVSGYDTHKIYAAVLLNGLKSSLSTATYTIIEVGAEGDWQLVTSVDQITDGYDYIIVNSDHDRAIKSGALETSRFYSVECENNVVFGPNFATATVAGSDVRIFGFETEDDNIYMKDADNSRYYNFATDVSTGKQPVYITMADGFVYIKGAAEATRSLAYNTANGNYFGIYATPTTTTGSQRPIYLYRRGVQQTPSMTLADICKYGVTTEGKNEYIIADKLQAVYAYTKGGNSLLWCKDLGNKSIVPTTIHSGQIDFMREPGINTDTEGVHNGQQGPWDQSNWIVLQFTNPTGSNNIDEMLRNAQDKFIKPGTIKGKLVDDENYILKMDLDQLELVTQADPDYDEEPYNENVYCPANFLPENLNIHDGIENGDGAQSGNVNYFFMNPKVQEICYITYAQWDNDLKYFSAPSSSGIDGAFQVGWVYQDQPALESGKIYKFHAVVHRVGKEYGPQNPVSTKDGMPVYANITVLPIDLTADSEVVTSINTVETGNGEVKSVKYVNVAGMVSDVPFQGVNIVVTEYSDGSRSTSKMLRK